jgi:uncharacterized protein YjbJ (UPF0337 family)
MNKDIEGNWKQMRGNAKEPWGKLTESDLDRMTGKRDQLISESADEKVERCWKKYDQKSVAQTERTQRMNKRQSIGW